MSLCYVYSTEAQDVVFTSDSSVYSMGYFSMCVFFFFTASLHHNYTLRFQYHILVVLNYSVNWQGCCIMEFGGGRITEVGWPDYRGWYGRITEVGVAGLQRSGWPD